MSDSANDIKKQALEISMLYNISELAQSVAYEINNPLMIISGYSKKIRKNNGSEDYNDLEKDLLAIEKSSDRISEIIQNLLAYSKQSLELPLSKSPFQKLVEDSIQLYRDTSNTEDLAIEFENKTESNILVNPILCVQCIVNVFRFSVGHSKVTGQPKLQLSFRERKDRIELVIKDNAEKLAEEVQAKMFYQTFSTETGEGSVGMGMNSSFNIAKKFKGDLYFDNSYPENAFILSFTQS
ncbi:MAG: hypothetical protein CME70_19570 [Halobacteriovorax sp.]|nr:hypothetical protein [Halobacteriovorax sp.]|tara:strand:+ start:1931 stop:2647 length:717 start_codon:yes stop_codon:yes gene_type:complete